MGVMNKAMRFVGPAVLPKVSHHRGLIDTYTHFFINEQVEKNTILYESRDGKSLTDSPFAIFEYLLKEDKEQIYTHIWSVTNGKELETVKAHYKDNRNVLFVTRNSKDYLKWLAKAAYLINNSTFQSFVTIKKEQTYINTWHGTPLKTMGFDIPGNPADAKNVVRNFFMADYLISPNQHTTEMFLKSYRLNNNYQGQIIETGYPRIDQTYAENKDEILKMLFDFGVELDLSKKILLYTPTCKSGDLSVVSNEVAQIHKEMSTVRKTFGDTYNVLIKVHPFLYDKAKEYEAIKKYLIPDVADTNKVLGLVDVLLTDYSSIFFDFLVTDKPILFYCWDDDLYSNKRGKYFEYNELPGPVSFNVDELLLQIENLDELTHTFRENYQRCKEKFTSYDDGNVTRRVVDIIFNQKSLPDVSLISGDKSKKSLLIYPGGMRSNGITSSFLNLMNSIDFSQYRVVCLLDNIKTDDQIKNVSAIPHEVTLLFRFDLSNFTVKEYYQDLIIHMRGVKKGKYPEGIYRREANRLLGKSVYNTAIDFSGYSLHWSKIILGATANRYLCYLHSDMKQDQARVVEGKQIHKMNLQGIFSVYEKYDQLVSVSEAISEINAEKLADYAPADKFSYATNTINIDAILGLNEQPKEIEMAETGMFIRNGELLNIETEISVKSTRPDMPLGKQQKKKFSHSEVSVLGRFSYKGNVFYKMSQDNSYIGWVEQKEVAISPVSIVSEKDVSLFGKLNTALGDQLYTEPLGLEKSAPLSDVGRLRNVYIKASKEVVTQEGVSVLVELKGNKLGWLPKNQVTWSKKLNTSKPSVKIKALRQVVGGLNHLQNREKLSLLKTMPLKKEVLANYFENTQKGIVLAFEAPNKEASHKPLEQQSILYVESLATNSLGRWYEIVMEDGGTVWVKEEQLSLRSLKEEQVVLEKEVFQSALSQELTVEVFTTLEDVFESRGQTVRSLPVYDVIKEVMTSEKKEYALITYEDKDFWVKKEVVTFKEKEGITNASGELISFPDKSKINIVTTGRLSEEKNQTDLIEAFTMYQENNPDCHLYLIGAGPEEKKLSRQISELKQEKNITLLGQVYYPFSFMKECDIFALTSLYEGQSMVLLEALTLEMKCLSTDIPACRNVLEDGAYGILTKTNDPVGIAKGLEELVNANKETFASFDPYAYNQNALEKFYELLN